MHSLLKELFPICRSITGEGQRRTLDILNQRIPLTLHRFSSGTRCFDWEVPLEWNIRSAVLRKETGETVVDFANNSLHVLGYSESVNHWFTLDELRPHLYSLPDQPDAIPYVTSYYSPRWGFCLRDRELQQLQPGKYHAFIDAAKSPGELVVADCVLPGETEREILCSCYTCHPSMANDSLSGVVLATRLCELLRDRPRHYSYRFVFAPETIGVIAYLSRFGKILKERTAAGFVVTCVGDPGAFHYKRSRQGRAPADRVVENVLRHSGLSHEVRDFWPMGSDERQYCSPGFDLPVGSLMRSVYGEFPQYHTSLDDSEFVTASSLDESLHIFLSVVEALEGNHVYQRVDPFCEPHLGKRGLYPTITNHEFREAELQRRMWLLNLADGKHDLIDIADRAGCSVNDLIPCARELHEAGLITIV